MTGGTTGAHGPTTLAAAALLAAVLGSVHAFSVFLVPLEHAFGQSRGMVSLTYSLALVVLTLAVLWGHRWYHRWSAARFVTGICILGATGAVVAGYAPSLALIWLGYGVLFGAANGLGYGFGLQIAARANPGREGLAMGTVTAAYAFGAVVAPVFFSAAVEAGGIRLAMLELAAALLIAGPLAGAMLRAAAARYAAGDASGDGAGSGTRVPRTVMALLWVGYGSGVATGLMSIGHAAEIGAAFGARGAAWVAPAVIAACNLLGSLAAGLLADRRAPFVLLCGLAAGSALAALLLALAGGPASVVPWLGLIGFAYGGIIAVYPAAIAKIFGAAQGPAIYGRVFTAWGTAGLLGPWLAGSLFDLTGGYDPALMVAGGLGVVSALSALSLAVILNRTRDTRP